MIGRPLPLALVCRLTCRSCFTRPHPIDRLGIFHRVYTCKAPLNDRFARALMEGKGHRDGRPGYPKRWGVLVRQKSYIRYRLFTADKGFHGFWIQRRRPPFRIDKVTIRRNPSGLTAEIRGAEYKSY
jgi:hypothetical protein